MARLSTYTKDVNLTGKDMLAGSNYVTTVNGIDQFETNNFTLKKITEFINGQIVTDPSIISLKTNGGLVYETVNNTNYLAVDLAATNITGQLANSDLANSSITINGTEVSLGGTITIGEVTEVTAGTYLNGGGTEGSVTLNHDLTTRTDTVSTASPSYGDSFTVIDALTTNSTGHVSAANVKTITLPSSDDTTYTIEAIASTNDSIIRLVGSDSTTDDVKLIAGSNITLSTSEINDTITISSQAFGNVYTVNSEAAMIAATSQAGDLVVRTDVSKTFIHNGGTTGTVADFTELQFSGINNIALTAGNGITLSRTSITNADNDLTITNALATSTAQGGIELFSDTEQTVAANAVTAEAGRTYGIQLNSDDQAVVNVPWVNTNTQNTTTLSFVDSGNDIILRNTTGGAGSGDQDINIVAGSNITLTHTDANNITIASTDTNTFRTVEVDTNGDGSANETLGAAETLRFKKGTNVTLAESNGIITISSTDTNTTYSAGGGLDLTGTTFSHTDTSSAADLAATARTYVSALTFDTYGHVTAYATAAETVTARTDEEIRDVAAGQWVDGTNTTVVVDDNANTIKINATYNNTTYGISCVDGDNTDEEKIRLTGSDSTTDDVVLEAGTGLSIARDGDKITYTNTVTDTTNWNWKVNSVDATNVSAGDTVVLNDGNAIEISTSGKNATINHADTSSQASVNNSGRTYIQDITLDTYGHVTGLTSATETVTNTNDIDYINAASFDTSDGVLTLSGEGNAGATVDLDGRYLTSYTDTNYYLDGITQDGNTLTFSVNGTTNQTFTFGSNAFNSTAYLTSYTETSTLANVVSRGNSTNGTLEVTGAGSWLTVEGNAANTSVPLSQGLAFGWNRSGGTNETEIIFRGSTAGHSSRLDIRSWDGSSFRTLAQFNGDESIIFPNSGNIVAEESGGERILQRSYDGARWARLVSNSVGGELQLGRSNSAHVKLVTLGDSYLNGGNVGIGITTPGTKLDVNGVITATGGTSTNWNTAYGWGDHSSAGYLTSFDITTQTDPKYLRSNADDTSSGSLTVVSYKFNGNATNPTDTTATIYDQSGVGLTASAYNFSIRNYNGSSMVESARFTTSSLTVIGDVIAYGSPSDISLKENIKPIENALDKVEKLQGVTFDWKESDSILDIKEDIGFIAQDVQKVLPELVRENENGKLSLRHQGIIPVLLEAIKELSNRIKVLENGGTE